MKKIFNNRNNNRRFIDYKIIYISSFLFLSVALFSLFITTIAETKSLIFFVGCIFASISFILLQLFCELFGFKASRKALNSTLVVIIILFLLLYLAGNISLHYNEILNQSNNINLNFNITLELVLAALVGFTIPAYLSLWLFTTLKRQTKGKGLWFRSFVALILAQTLNATLIVAILYSQILTFKELSFTGIRNILTQLILTIPLVVFLVLILKLIRNKRVHIRPRQNNFNSDRGLKNEKYNANDAKSSRTPKENGRSPKPIKKTRIYK